MDRHILNRKTLGKAVAVYVSLFLLYLLIGRIIPVANLLATSAANTLLSSAFAGIGALLVLADLLTDRYLFRSRNWWALLLFAVSMGISMVTNLRYGFGSNVKTMVWTCIQFFLLYCLVCRFGSENSRVFLSRLLFALSLLWTLFVLFSIVQYALQTGYRIFDYNAGYSKRQGFVDNRLFGVFLDPNFAAITSLCVIFIWVYFLEIRKAAWERVLCVLMIAIHASYIILSGSRTILICLFGATLVKTVLSVRNLCLKKQLTVGRSVGTVLIALAAVSIIFFGLYTGGKKALAQLPVLCEPLRSMNQSQILQPEAEKDPTRPTRPGQQDDYDADEVFHREDVKEDNILNNRAQIWQSYLESLHGSKWIFGLSPRNALAYIRDNYPDNYIAQTGYSAHSDYIALISYTGLSGVACALLFAVLAALQIFRTFFGKQPMDPFYIMALTIFAALIVFGIPFMEIYFSNSLTAALFWIMASVVMHFRSSDEPVQA